MLVIINNGISNVARNSRNCGSNGGHNFSNSQNEDGRNKKGSVCLLRHQRTCEQIK